MPAARMWGSRPRRPVEDPDSPTPRTGRPIAMPIPVRFSTWLRAGCVCVSAVAMLVPAGCTPDVKDIRTQGINEFRSRQYVESTATMRHVLELSPNDAQANYY